MSESCPEQNTLDGVVNEDYACLVCLQFRSNIVLACAFSHRICEDCLKQIPNPVCPMCRDPILKDHRGNHIVDRTANQAVLSARVKCRNNGCDFVGSYEGLLEHEKSCEFRKVACKYSKCFGCTWTGEQREQERHEKTLMHTEIFYSQRLK